MKVASYQAPFPSIGIEATIALIRQQIERCELEGVEILCCPEAVLGGLADYAGSPSAAALKLGDLDRVLRPLTSLVTTILGFTETDSSGTLFNSAAVFNRGSVHGIYRKIHPAIRQSVYASGSDQPVFELDGLRFGILICNDSNFPELATGMAKKGAKAIFIPTNNSLPGDRDDVSDAAREADIRIARTNGVFVVRADVAGNSDTMISYGSSEILDREGTVICEAQRSANELIFAEI